MGGVIVAYCIYISSGIWGKQHWFLEGFEKGYGAWHVKLWFAHPLVVAAFIEGQAMENPDFFSFMIFRRIALEKVYHVVDPGIVEPDSSEYGQRITNRRGGSEA